MSPENTGPRPEDLPWNDEPADNDALPGSSEPDPAEVVGDETDARDLAAPRLQDPYARDTLDQRLKEEEPDRPVGTAPAPEAGELQAGERSEQDVEPGEPDQYDPAGDDDELPAEEAAMHVVDDDRIL